MKIMKTLTFAIGAILYLGSLSLLNNAYAHEHHDRSPIKMLFKDIDLTEDQRSEVRSIMSSSIEEGRTIRAEMREESMDAMDELKEGTHEQIATVLSQEQMAQFDKNSQRMEQRAERMREGKMKDHKKGKKGRDKKRHKEHKKKQH
ncbi:MAG: hypothetical protein QF513_02640 [Gammaproteobacteria bacterium]|jgi:hypothetical protein|nr:hypothetical protein [Gammaproteobacteria bacterium]MBQ08376.1 hypothetical protein [Gammaproteobacteria bacterium]MDP6146674.1 hypothetical protein [Gammaproteobacteria bacterium]HJM09118.1 hypothetical protein [Gammaproteobacteria bacterium]HJN01235.1 hypothetical protein [Gammaproteobacteria bacterium]|tara:strand:- start:16560 stop:16997 length:438 start_codon:yes stop_codon:yes gene_type:complete